MEPSSVFSHLDDDDEDDDDNDENNEADISSETDETSFYDPLLKTSTLLPPPSNRYCQLNGSATVIDIPSSRRKIKFPTEFRKTLLSGLFMLINFVGTTTSLAIIHERRPLYPPLPDLILDSIEFQDWALDASEILLQFMTFPTILLIIFHKHRMIVMRRAFFILGLLYGYRAITMFVTVLPSANPSYHCAPKLMENGQVLSFKEVFRRVIKILSGFGLSINGQHVYCGDFIYSGHTMIAVFCYLVINEYTNKKWFILHWIYWTLAVSAVTMLMFARGHYSIDIIIAYYITTRLFWLYHSIAYSETLQRTNSETSHSFSKIWWWRILVYFESNVHSGPIPNTFHSPLHAFTTVKRIFTRVISRSS